MSLTGDAAADRFYPGIILVRNTGDGLSVCEPFHLVPILANSQRSTFRCSTQDLLWSLCPFRSAVSRSVFRFHTFPDSQGHNFSLCLYPKLGYTSGFFISDAIFERNLFSDIPMEHHKSSSFMISFIIFSAI